jgi:hypothetical protein
MYGLDGKVPRHHTHSYDVRLKRPADRYVKGLEFMNAMWRKREKSHPMLSAVVQFLYGLSVNRGCLAQELLVSLSKAWHVQLSVLHILQYDTSFVIYPDGRTVC